MKQPPICPNCNTNFENIGPRKPYTKEFTVNNFEHLEFIPRICHCCEKPHMYLTLRLENNNES